jgi:REP element-mobilizing transposase RayT
MARPLRVEYPGAFYHVMNRGNAGEAIFPEDGEKEKFLDCLQRTSRRFSIRLHAFCLMTTHYHLLVETPRPNLSRAIQWLNVSYAGWYNRRQGRNGHLFQGRFKALLVEADPYLSALSRYIHLNPVRAGMVREPEAYPWSSCLDFLGERPLPEWLETGLILSGFHAHRPTAIRRYRAFLAAEGGAENPNAEAAAGFLLGSSGFVDQIRRNYLEERPTSEDMPQLRVLQRLTPEAVMRAVRDEFGGTEEDILRKGARGSLPRLVAVGLARELCGMGGRELGRYFGGISGAAITLVGKKFERELSRDSDFRAKVERARERCFKIKM